MLLQIGREEIMKKKKNNKNIKKQRQIDVTKEDVRCCDELIVGDEEINATYELWFDVDAYFGTDTRDDDSSWINFYTEWHPKTDDVTAYYVIDMIENPEEHEWPLTEKEKEFFREKMETFCQQADNCSLLELWKRYNS